MTVSQLIDALQQYDKAQMVYIPDYTDKTVQLVSEVLSMPHLNTPDGITIPDDVILLPLSMRELETDW